jgi:hypothetical protein
VVSVEPVVEPVKEVEEVSVCRWVDQVPGSYPMDFHPVVEVHAVHPQLPEKAVHLLVR